MKKQKIISGGKSKKKITKEEMSEAINFIKRNSPINTGISNNVLDKKPVDKTIHLNRISHKEIKRPELKDKSKKEETELEKEIEDSQKENKKFSSFPMEKEIVDEKFVEFLQPSTKIPVLEKIARNEDTNLEEQLGSVVFKPREAENRGTINYTETKSNYLATANPNGDNDVKYVQSSDYVTMLQENKESRETRNIMRNTGERIVGEKRQNRWENIEKETFVEGNNNTKKYLARGDYR